MKSISKRELDFNIVNQMVKKAFKVSIKEDDICELTDGYFNMSYRVKIDNENIVVLKVAPDPKVKVMTYENMLMKTEVLATKIMNEAKLKVPKVLFYDDSKTIIDSDYFFMSFIDGVMLNKVKKNMSEEKLNSLYSELGKCMNKLLDVNSSYFGEIGNPNKRFSTFYECFKVMILDLIEDANRMKLKIPINSLEAIKILEDNKKDLEEVNKPILVHKDLWDGNIFVSEASHDFVGIIDLERAIYADPLLEIVCGHLVNNLYFIRSYYGKEEFSFSEKRRIELYKFYLFLLMLIECPYRKYDNDKQMKWAYVKLNESLSKLLK